MKKIIYTCDRCGKEILGNFYKICVDEIERENEDLSLDSDRYPDIRQRDYCQECTDYLASVINQKTKKGAPAQINTEFSEAVEEMVATSQSEDKPKRQRLDIGKIMALHNAKWSAKAIAEEMGCSVQAVYDAVWRNKKKAPEPGQQEGQLTE